MRRGTTPVLKFKLPFEVSLLSEVWITLVQCGVEILNRTLEDCDIEGADTLCVTLTQAETLKLEDGLLAELQLRALTTDGAALASQIISEYVGRILRDGVIADDTV